MNPKDFVTIFGTGTKDGGYDATENLNMRAIKSKNKLEMPTASFYNRSRRIHRGLFRSNAGICINADVNAAYQILKAGGIKDLKIKQTEPVRIIKAA